MPMQTQSSLNSKYNSYIIVSIILLLGLSIALRVIALPYGNLDTKGYLEWYHQIAKHGIAAFKDDFSVYSPPYLYLLWLARRFLGFLPPEIAIKLIPLPFDLFSAAVIYKIARTQNPNGYLPLLFSSVFLCLPTMIANSSLWGQIDSVYASFLLLCFYFLMKRQPYLAMTAFGIAFSIKAQAIFLLPLLGILLIKKYMRWFAVLLIPAVYFIAALPAAYVGKSWESILTLYFGQLEHFEEIAKTAPNLYIFIPLKYYHPVLEIGLTIFFIVMLAWAWVNLRNDFPYNNRQLALTALASVTLVPFLLPKMHDRYFYPADIFSFVTAVLIPELWFLPVLFQISSGFAYTIFLFGWDPVFVYIAAIINTGLVIYIARTQVDALRAELSPAADEN